jgi:hypothetical protein
VWPCLRYAHPTRREQRDATDDLDLHRRVPVSEDRAAIRMPCACSTRTGLPLQPCRRAHSVIERCRPATCQTQEPARLPRPPMASRALPTRLRASSCASVKSAAPPPPGSRIMTCSGPNQVGHRELGLKIACGVVHGMGDPVRPQQYAEGIHRAVVDQGTAVRIGLMHRLEDTIRPPYDRQTSIGLGCGPALASRHHATSRGP